MYTYLYITQEPQKVRECPTIGRSKVGLSSKITQSLMLWALQSGHLTPRQAHDLYVGDRLLPGIEADNILADEAYDANEGVITPLIAGGKVPIIPQKYNRMSKDIMIVSFVTPAV